MRRKRYIKVRGERVWYDFGWFTHDPFTLFSILLFEIPTGYADENNFITLFDLRIIKFCISFGLYL